VFGLDRKVAGTVVDLWVDKSDVLLRYVEVELVGSGKRVLIPLGVVSWRGEGPVTCETATCAQIAAAPATAHPERVTLREEDRISGYFGGGELYAQPGDSEPFA
jgi:photosynthetic reaction center H subunit